MPLTLRDLVGEPALHLTAHAEVEALERPVSWVHTTELADPSPFLTGGELLLTTGLGLAAEDFPSFVGRLQRVGIAGLGFGVGLSHPEIPAELAAAAERAGLPLLEVPKDTPFMAISKAASRAFAAAEHDGLRRTSRAQQELAREAGRADGLAGVVRCLSELLDGWVLLLDSSGAAMHAAPAASVLRLGELTAHVERLRSKKGLAALETSLGGAQISVQVLGAHSRGFLVVGRAEGFDTTDHHVINSAASLLALALDQRAHLNAAWRRLRAGFLELVLRGEPAGWEELDSQLPAGPVRVVALSAPGEGTAALLVRLETERPRTPLYLAEHRGVVVALAADGGAALEWLAELPQRHPGIRVGVSRPCSREGVATGLHEARQALAATGRGTSAVLGFDEIAGRGLLRLLAPSDARAFAESLLAPLLRHEPRADLLVSLREWLSQNGQWDAAASRLGVHRHTLRNRMHKVASLLDRDLDDPGARAELWFALQAYEHVSG